MHRQSNKEAEENYAQFIYPILNILKGDVDKMKRKNEKYIYENGN